MHILDIGAWFFYGYGKRPLYPLGWSIFAVLLFGIIWWSGDRKTPHNGSNLGILEKYGCDKADSTGRQLGGKNWMSKVRLLGGTMLFSATIFLSGTRLFIDPPVIPEMSRWSKSKTKMIFITERVLGAFFSILFFLAIGATVIR
jgi:hypothetical protein